MPGLHSTTCCPKELTRPLPALTQPPHLSMPPHCHPYRRFRTRCRPKYRCTRHPPALLPQQVLIPRPQLPRALGRRLLVSPPPPRPVVCRQAGARKSRQMAKFCTETTFRNANSGKGPNSSQWLWAYASWLHRLRLARWSASRSKTQQATSWLV
jgi:hypothetical protein